MDLAYKHESNEMNLISIIIHTYIVFTGIQIEKAVRIITDEMPVIPLYHFHVVYVKSPSLKRVAISPMGDVEFHKAYLKGK